MPGCPRPARLRSPRLRRLVDGDRPGAVPSAVRGDRVGAASVVNAASAAEAAANGAEVEANVAVAARLRLR